MSLLWMDTVLLFFFAEKTQSLGMIDTQDHKQLINDHAKIGPVTELEVFEFARALVMDVQVPSRQPVNVKSCLRIL